MARKTIDQGLEADRLRREQLDARIKKLQSQQAKIDRVRDTRTKVLLGMIVLARLDSRIQGDESLRDWLEKEVPSVIERDADRALLDKLLSGKA